MTENFVDLTKHFNKLKKRLIRIDRTLRGVLCAGVGRYLHRSRIFTIRGHRFFLNRVLFATTSTLPYRGQEGLKSRQRISKI